MMDADHNDFRSAYHLEKAINFLRELWDEYESELEVSKKDSCFPSQIFIDDAIVEGLEGQGQEEKEGKIGVEFQSRSDNDISGKDFGQVTSVGQRRKADDKKDDRREKWEEVLSISDNNICKDEVKEEENLGNDTINTTSNTINGNDNDLESLVSNRNNQEQKESSPDIIKTSPTNQDAIIDNDTLKDNDTSDIISESTQNDPNEEIVDELQDEVNKEEEPNVTQPINQQEIEIQKDDDNDDEEEGQEIITGIDKDEDNSQPETDDETI